MKIEEIVTPLLQWYHLSHRDLPWRNHPTFYHVWLSEIMLQQTRVEAVKDYYRRFLEELPTIHDLAVVPENKLLKLWEGLGYYNRARNLQKAAIQIETDFQGIPPQNYSELLTLSGIGEYTAGAIASICYGEKVPAIDGNVLRVITRITNDKSDIMLPATKKKIAASLLPILPDEVGDFNQALMELGAMVCLPNGEPKCNSCPLRHLCQAYENKTISMIPVKTKKKARKKIEKTILLCINYDKVAIQKRPATGLLSGLWEFPNVEEYLTREEVLDWCRNHRIEPIRMIELGDTKHIFTHLEWHMRGFAILISEGSDDFTWATWHKLSKEYAIPTAFKKYQDALQEIIKDSL